MTRMGHPRQEMSTWEVPRDGEKNAEQSCPAGTPLGPPPIPRKQSDMTLAGTVGREPRQSALSPGGTSGLGALVPTLMAMTAVHEKSRFSAAVSGCKKAVPSQAENKCLVTEWVWRDQSPLIRQCPAGAQPGCALPWLCLHPSFPEPCSATSLGYSALLLGKAGSSKAAAAVLSAGPQAQEGGGWG